MGSRRLRVSFWGLVAAIAIAAPLAEASSVTYYLNQSNENVLFPDGTNYGTVTIADGLNGNIDFTVAVVPGAFSAGTNFGFQSFGFNLASPLTLNAISNFTLPSGWSASTNSNQDGFGNFAWVVSTTGTSRESPLEFTIHDVTGDLLSSYFALSSNQAGEGNQYFAAHITGFNDPRGENIPWGTKKVTSAFIAGGPQVVPLPATAWLLLSGVVGLGALARRRLREAA